MPGALARSPSATVGDNGYVVVVIYQNALQKPTIHAPSPPSSAAVDVPLASQVTQRTTSYGVKTTLPTTSPSSNAENPSRASASGSV
jgi:hypothetical protein